MKGNDFVRLMLQSPLQVVLGNMMVITVTGRRTGRQISLPVNYYQDGDTLWIISTRSRNWWRNVTPGSQVRLRLHGKDILGTAELVFEAAAVADQVAAHVRHFPLSARALGVRVENGVPNPADIQRVAGERLFVAVCTQQVTPGSVD
jgi:deazaflavin-dependent oxidoreductase (nitroreductase family)